MPRPLHEGQALIDEDLVVRLLATQHPDLAHLPLTEVRSTGTVNAVYRLGDELCVRLPLLASGATSLDRELTWLPWLAERLPVAVPEPVTVGAPDPDLGYPHRWAVYRWLDGDLAPTGSTSDALADDLVALVLALRDLPAADAPVTRGRRALADHDAWARPGIEQLGPDRAGPTAAVWADALAADGPATPTWVHGDLMPANLLVRDDRLVAVLDWGEPGLGDPAADLWCAWSVLDRPRRERMFAALAADEATVARSRGWVVRTAALGIPYYRTSNPGFAALADHALAQVLWGGERANG